MTQPSVLWTAPRAATVCSVVTTTRIADAAARPRGPPRRPGACPGRRSSLLPSIGLIVTSSGFIGAVWCYRTFTQRSSTLSLGHCTALTFFAIAHESVRRYSGT